MTPTEFWLPVGAVAFYVYDSTSLLWQNDLIYLRAGGRWIVEGGSEIRIGGRRLHIPNPLLPHRPQFLMRWSATDSRGVAANPTVLLEALRPIGALGFAQAMLLCILPVALWLSGAVAALGVFMLFYLSTVASLVIMYHRRAVLGLSRRGFWLLVLDGLACAPFAVNFTRKLALRHGLVGDPLGFAARYFDADSRAQVRELVETRICEEHAAPEAAERRGHVLSSVLTKLGG